jgi:uncharacterized protein YkwD
MNASPHPKISLTIASLVCIFLAACGGGSDGSSQAPLISGPAIEPPAREASSVPQGIYDDALRSAAFARLRQIRSEAGVGVLKQKDFVDMAAQSHSKYQVINNISTHDEVPGMPGFVAKKFMQRIDYFGVYPSSQGQTDGFEVTISALSFVGDATPELAQKLVDGLMSGPYHRSAMLDPEFTDVGVGLYVQDKSVNLNINATRTIANTQGAPNNLLINWPPNGSTNIPTEIAGEESGGPNRPGIPAGRGYAASVQTNCSLRGIYKIIRFEMRDAAGNLVETQPVSSGCFESILPLKSLNARAVYSVSFEGTIRRVDDRIENSIQKNWSFTTGEKITF